MGKTSNLSLFIKLLRGAQELDRGCAFMKVIIKLFDVCLLVLMCRLTQTSLVKIQMSTNVWTFCSIHNTTQFISPSSTPATGKPHHAAGEEPQNEITNFF